MSATDGLLGSTEATVDDLRTIERLARAAREKELSADPVADHEAAHDAYIDRCEAEDALSDFATPERILSMVERLREAQTPNIVSLHGEEAWYTTDDLYSLADDMEPNTVSQVYANRMLPPHWGWR